MGSSTTPVSGSRAKNAPTAFERISWPITLAYASCKGIRLLFDGGVLLPVEPSLKERLIKRRYVLKQVSSVIAVPHFACKQVKLVQAGLKLKQDIVGLYKTGELPDQKRFFFTAMQAATSLLKLPLKLHKLNFIALDKTARKLAAALNKGAAVLTLGKASIKFIEKSFKLGKYLSSAKRPELKKIFHDHKAKKLARKFVSSSCKFAVVSIIASAKLFKWKPPSVVVVGASAVSFALSARKFIRKEKFFMS